MANTITALTANQDIDYIQKDAASALDAMIAFANINFGPGTSANRLWTNFNVSSFSRNWLEIVAFIADVFFFYLDTQATEAYLQTATLQSSIAAIAQQFGFVPASAASASGVATFTTSGIGIIPRGFRTQSSTGLQFYVTNPITVTGAGQFSGNVLQGIIQTDQYAAQGLQNEQFTLTGPNVILDQFNVNALDDTPQITVNGNAYTLVQTFLNSNGTDTPAVVNSLGEVVGGGGRVFELGVLPNGSPYIEFGDGIFGRKLNPGDVVVATYRTGGGSAGNIGAQSLTTLVDSNPIVTSVTNAAAFSGGADAQSINQLRSLIPSSLRTLQRAVALPDFADILVANFSQVFAASAEGNTQQAGVDVNIYVVPQGVGISPITANPTLLNTLTNFIDTRKMVTIQFQILDAFGIYVLIGLRVFINSTASRTTVEQNINTAITNFFSLTTGGPQGDGVGFAQEILIKDLTNVIENISGIQRFEFTEFSYSPRVQKNIVSINTTYDVTPVTIFPNVGEYEWLLGAAGPASTASGVHVFTNTSLVAYTYTGSTGIIQYALAVDLTGVSVGDQFKDGASALFTIVGVDTKTNKIYLNRSLSVNTTVGSSASGSVISSANSYESFKCFRKFLGTITNLSENTITDNNLDITVLSGTGTAIEATLLLDNTQTFIPNQYATGDFFLIDAAGNVWDIISNQSNTLRTSITAINDAGISTVASGGYKIVENFSGQQIVVNHNVFTIDYNTDTSIFSNAAEFNLISTIGNMYEISQLQNNIGVLGTAVDIISVSGSVVNLNSSVDLTGLNSDYELIDNTGQVFNITAVNNLAQFIELYDESNQDDAAKLSGVGAGITPLQYGTKLAQGFKVSNTTVYPVASFNLSRMGNIQGSLTLQIVNDDGGGLPNLSSVVATSNTISVSEVSQSNEFTTSNYGQVFFSFPTSPTLTAATQYHLVLNGDALYASTEISDVTLFSNTGLVAFTYNSLSGLVQYASSVAISAVSPNNYFKDGAGNLFRIISVNAGSNQLTLATGLTVNNTVSTAADGSILQDDRVLLSTDTSGPTYANGEMSRFDGTFWSNSTLGPDPSSILTDAIFSIQSVKTLTIESNLTPTTGLGATVAKRYYDDNDEISLIVGFSGGVITSASDITPDGTGTVGGNPDRPVDNFVFRTSPYIDDIVNLRQSEIPQIQTSGISITLFGGAN